VATRDVPDLDLDLPDVPDDDDLDDLSLDDVGTGASDAAEAAGDDSAHAPARKPSPLAGAIALVAGFGGPLVARVGLLAAPLVVRIAPLLALVPLPVRVAGTVALAVMALGGIAVGATSALRPTPTPIPTVRPAASVPVLPTRAPATPTVVLPTPTVTPAVFRKLESGWIVDGPPRPNPVHQLPADRFLLLDRAPPVYTMVTRVEVLLRRGSAAPIWGIVLSHRGPNDHLKLEFFTDSYQRDRPFVGLVTTQNGQSRLIGPNHPIPELEFWGRDIHEVRVQVVNDAVQLWVNSQPTPEWKVPGGIPVGSLGLYVWGGSTLRFHSLTSLG